MPIEEKLHRFSVAICRRQDKSSVVIVVLSFDACSCIQRLLDRGVFAGCRRRNKVFVELSLPKSPFLLKQLNLQSLSV
jgi:hypothetical protein